VNHAVALPVLVPAVCAALMLLAGDARIGLQRALGVVSCLALLALGAAAVVHTSGGAIEVYLLGAWPAPYGIVLVLDRLAALMLALTAVLALPVLAAAIRGGADAWDTRGRHFHVFFQFQLMGLDGAFLTGDLFNLFVFFEVLLLASYCLLAHGRGPERLASGFHYVVVNLAASGLFLIGVATLYGATGTLNLADLAARVPRVAPADQALVSAAALVLLVVFAVKAAVFPLYFWLPRAYTAAAPPVAALFAVMTKVGVYAIIRVHGVVFGADAGPAALLAAPWLLYGAVATAAFGAFGALAARTLGRMTAYLTIASVGTLLVAVAAFSTASLSAALYYLVHSTLAIAALFLLGELIGGARGPVGDRLEPAAPARRAAALGTLLVLAAVSLAGLPPLSGFVGKLMILQASAGAPVTPLVWAVILATGFGAMVALAHAGSVLFWKTLAGPASAPVGVRAPTLGAAAPCLALVVCGLALTVFAAPAKRYLDAAAAQLADRRLYATEVLGTPAPRTTRPFPPETRP
jgi:multicomponent K+:H+ antiporter subunit D